MIIFMAQKNLEPSIFREKISQYRHPNYFGEVQMWWGVWLMYASLRGIDWLILAPVAMIALFLFISIPMMERRQLERKPGYAEYRKQTRMLI